MMDDFLQLLPEPGMLLTPDGEILAANPAMGRLLDRSRSSLVNARLADLLHSDVSKTLEWLRVSSSSRTLVPCAIKWKPESGSPIEARADVGLLCPEDSSSGRPAVLYLRCRPQAEAIGRFLVLNEKIAALSREIDERRRTQEALHRSEARYRTLVSATSTAVWSADARGSFAENQPSWELFTGQASTAYQGDGWLTAVHDEDRSRIAERWRESIGTGRPLDVQARIQHCSADGYRRCLIRAVPVQHDDGSVTEWVGTVTDIEEQKQFEEQLRQAQRLESLGVLAGGVAHDFNNLLVGILGNASLALETISSNSPARLMLKDVVAASESAATLTRQLLAYAGKGRFLIEPVDLSDLIRQISKLIQTSIPKTVQLRCELADRLPCIEADASQMQQLIMNLVINGAEAIGDVPGTVMVTTGLQDVDEQYIHTVLAPDQIAPGRYVTLEVHDTGVGMTEETVSRIFDPFFTTKFQGRGLGLAAVLGIVRGHKGAIKVYSTLGRGTTFKVLFPASDQEKPAAPPKATVERRGGVEGVLVIDDEQVVRRTAKSMLERYGYTVYVAENGREGVDLFRGLGKNVDLVLLDMTMPIMSGEETFRELKALNPNIPVILSSGYNEVEAVQRFTGKGLAGFIQKPYSAATLSEKVRTIIHEWRTRADSLDSD